MQQELIAEIHRTAIWPVVVTVDGNISKSKKTDFIDGDGSYIILIQDGNIESFEGKIYGLILGHRKFTGLSNSKTLFFVAGTNEYTKSQQTDIFEYLSIYRIYNCIIVSQEHYVTDKEYRSPIKGFDMDLSMKFGVYTWFPHRSSDRCTEVNYITLLDSWVISAQGYLNKNTDLFPQKINKSLNWCRMKAVVRKVLTYFNTLYVKQTYLNGSVSMYVKGLEINLLRITCKR